MFGNEDAHHQRDGRSFASSGVPAVVASTGRRHSFHSNPAPGSNRERERATRDDTGRVECVSCTRALFEIFPCEGHQQEPRMMVANMLLPEETRAPKPCRTTTSPACRAEGGAELAEPDSGHEMIKPQLHCWSTG